MSINSGGYILLMRFSVTSYMYIACSWKWSCLSHWNDDFSFKYLLNIDSYWFVLELLKRLVLFYLTYLLLSCFPANYTFRYHIFSTISLLKYLFCCYLNVRIYGSKCVHTNIIWSKHLYRYWLYNYYWKKEYSCTNDMTFLDVSDKT